MSSELLNPPFLVQNAGGETRAKMLPCVSMANSCQLARRSILGLKGVKRALTRQSILGSDSLS